MLDDRNDPAQDLGTQTMPPLPDHPILDVAVDEVYWYSSDLLQADAHSSLALRVQRKREIV